MGNTGILYAALRAGAIDLYPEYTGTIAREILKVEGNPGLQDIDRALEPQEIVSLMNFNQLQVEVAGAAEE